MELFRVISTLIGCAGCLISGYFIGYVCGMWNSLTPSAQPLFILVFIFLSVLGTLAIIRGLIK
jgi:hypothetical protein